MSSNDELRQAAKQALEALVSENSLSAVAMQQRMDAITALRAALAEPVQAPHMYPLQSDRMQIDPVTGDVRIGTAPPQRKPLTREEVISLWADKSDGPGNGEIVSFARAIERAHGIEE